MSSIINRDWKLIKTVLPQHTDHAGVMWHGSYLNFLEESRIDALKKVGITYSELSEEGFEFPVISLNIKYKISFIHGETFILKSQFKIENKIRFNCKTFFLKTNGDIGSEALIELVVVKKNNKRIEFVRELPIKIKNILSLLEKGPKI